MDDKEGYQFAKMTGEGWFMLEDLGFAKKPVEEQQEDCLKKWRKFLAIMEVALRQPIYYSRFMPECIMLTWFFGFPGFGKDQDMERFKRIPRGVDLKVLQKFAQCDLFKPRPELPEEVKKYDYEGDDEFRVLCCDIHQAVLKVNLRHR